MADQLITPEVRALIGTETTPETEEETETQRVRGTNTIQIKWHRPFQKETKSLWRSE